MNDREFVEALVEAYRLDKPRPVEWCKVLGLDMPVVVMFNAVDDLKHESTHDSSGSTSVATGIRGVDK